MKTFLFILLATLLSTGLYAQQAEMVNPPDTDKIFTSKVDVMPQFKGGMDKFYERLQNIPYDFLARMNRIQGHTVVLLVVEKDGSVGEVKVLHGITPRQDDEVIKVVKHLSKWKPGLVNGKPVRVLLAVPVNFELLKS